MTDVKICGLRSVRDAEACAAIGVSAIGLNFWSKSPRYCDPHTAQEIVTAVGKVTRVVAVVVDMDTAAMMRLRRSTGIAWLQLHGAESPADLRACLPQAYKALGVRSDSAETVSAPTGARRSDSVSHRLQVLEESRRFAGDEILLDAACPGLPGGTGKTFDWELASAVARERQLILAGGLHPDNVAAAVRAVRPHMVDVASGVESAPGIKDMGKIQAFVDAVRSESPERRFAD